MIVTQPVLQKKICMLGGFSVGKVLKVSARALFGGSQNNSFLPSSLFSKRAMGRSLTVIYSNLGRLFCEFEGVEER